MFLLKSKKTVMIALWAENDDLYSVVDQEYCREVVGENSGKVGTIVHQAMYGDSRGRSRIDTETNIVDMLLIKNCSM